MKVIKGKIRAALGSFMDHASAAASKSSSAAATADRAILADIEAAVERCTDAHDAHVDDCPHVHELLFLVSNAPGAITFLSRRITARLATARAPAAALQALLLAHRLLRGGDRYFEQDFRGLWSSGDLRLDVAPRLSEHPPDAAAAAYAFLGAYSAYLEERMGWLINQGGNLEPIRPTPPTPPSPPPPAATPQTFAEEAAESLLFRLCKCQRLLDCVIHLMPEHSPSLGPGFAVLSALGIALRESFRVYESFREGVEVMARTPWHGLSKPLRVSAHEVLKKACVQTPELAEFYQRCQRSSVAKSLEYPLVRLVTPAQAAVMEERPASGDALFPGKLETTISTVWVEFSEEDFLDAGPPRTGGDADEPEKSMQSDL